MSTAVPTTSEIPKRPHTPDPALFGHGQAEHHGSWAPIIIAASVGFLVLGVLALKSQAAVAAAVVGLVILTTGLAWWIREDMVRFRKVVAAVHHEKGHPGPIIGMVLFIATEVLIFASIFAVWFMGKTHAIDHHGSWRPFEIELPLLATGINTAVLVASGGTLHWGYLGLKKGNYKRYHTGLVLTILLGAAFLVQQVREYLELITIDGLTLKGVALPAGDLCRGTGQAMAAAGTCPDVYGSAFFMLTGTHGAHVLGGLIFLAIVLIRSLKRTQSPEHHVALETAAFYWHFVDVVWIFLFIVVYLEWL